MTNGQRRTQPDSLICPGSNAGADAPDTRTDIKGLDPRRGSTPTVRRVRASSAGQNVAQSAADKSVCPDNADTLAGPSRIVSQHGPTKACSVISARMCKWGVTTRVPAGLEQLH